MGKRDRRRRREREAAQERLATPERKPRVPMEEWSVEMPFDSGTYLKRRAARPGEIPPPDGGRVRSDPG